MHQIHIKPYFCLFRFLQGVQMYDFLKTSLNLPYRINLSNLTEVRHTNGAVKHIRRVQQAPYPLTKITEDSETYGLLDATERTTTINIHNPPSHNIKPTPTATPSKSKKLFPNLGKLMHPAVINECDSIQSASTATSNSSTQSSSSSSGSSSTKLARQIFNNLNIFSHKHHQSHQDQSHSNGNSAANGQQSKQIPHVAKHEPHPHLRRAPEIGMQPNTRRLSSKSNSSTASTQNLIGTRRCRASYRSQDDDFYMETDGDSSCYSKSSAGRGDLGSGYGYRRPSVDTISTYLSHGSSASDMRYCSTEATHTGDDDVFLPSIPQQPLQHQQQQPQQPQPSPRPMNGSIVGVDADSDTISRFVHVVQHPEWSNCRPCVICLDELQQNPNNPAVSLIRCEHLMHLNCLNHLIITQSEEQQKQLPEANRKCVTLYIECPVCGIVYGEKYGNQPPGTMTWSIIPKQLAGHEGQNTIQIVYK